MVKEEKLQNKILHLESKQKTKKVGNYLFPVISNDEGNVSELRLQRLES